MPDDPFREADEDRTVFMPTPGGRMATPAPVPVRPVAPEPPERFDGRAVTSGLNPLVAAANPLLNVIPQLRGSLEHPNPNGLRDSLAQGVREFEARARAAGASTETAIAAGSFGWAP